MSGGAYDDLLQHYIEHGEKKSPRLYNPHGHGHF
jgi:hypothetical protein